MTERLNERAARHVVSAVLGVAVDRHEDGKAPSQVDALIRWPERPAAALEIVADHESKFNKQWDALEKVRHHVNVSRLDKRWSVHILRSARVTKLVKELPDVLRSLQHAPGAVDGWARRNLPAELAGLGVASARPLDDSGGRIELLTEGWSGCASSDDPVGEWVTGVLTRHPDVPAKLRVHPSPEKHAFIWTTIGSSYEVQFALEDRGQSLPTREPELPEGVTHVWVAGSMSSQGCLAYFPERGWWRTGWAWPPEGLNLDEDST